MEVHGKNSPNAQIPSSGSYDHGYGHGYGGHEMPHPNSPYGMPSGYGAPLAPPSLPPKKPSRVANFFLSLLPFLAFLGLQLIITLAVMVIMLAMEMAVSGRLAITEELISGTTKISMILFHLVGAAGFFLWYYLMLQKPRPKLGRSIRSCGAESYIVAAVMGFLMCVFSNGVVGVESLLVPQVVEDYMEMAEQTGLGNDIFIIALSVLVAPIGEELCFRGLTMRFAERAFPKHFWIANIWQAFLFGLLHMNWVQGVYAFGGGLVLGWIAKRYGSILPAIVMHFVVNFLSTFVIGYLLEPLPVTYGVCISLVVVPVAVAVLLMIWRRTPEPQNSTQNIH